MTEEMDENLKALENYWAGLTDGKLEGKNEGIIEGKTETQTLIVKNLLKNSIPDDIIINSTNISYEKLENIKKELNN